MKNSASNSKKFIPIFIGIFSSVILIIIISVVSFFSYQIYKPVTPPDYIKINKYLKYNAPDNEDKNSGIKSGDENNKYQTLETFKNYIKDHNLFSGNKSQNNDFTDTQTLYNSLNDFIPENLFTDKNKIDAVKTVNDNFKKLMANFLCIIINNIDDEFIFANYNKFPDIANIYGKIMDYDDKLVTAIQELDISYQKDWNDLFLSLCFYSEKYHFIYIHYILDGRFDNYKYAVNAARMQNLQGIISYYEMIGRIGIITHMKIYRGYLNK